MMRTRYFDEFQVPIQMIGAEEIVWKYARNEDVVVLRKRVK